MPIYQTFGEYNSTGASGLLTYPATALPFFTPMLLFAIYVILLMATYFAARRLNGRGDFIASMAASGFVTVVVAIIMSLIPGLINGTTLLTTFAVAVLGVVLLLLRD